MKQLLFHLKSSTIEVTIEAKFDDYNLIIEGYDIGTFVEEYWGDSDYEYLITVPKESVARLCNLFEINPDNKNAILEELGKKYNDNYCFSNIRNLLDANNIPYKPFSWT